MSAPTFGEPAPKAGAAATMTLSAFAMNIGIVRISTTYAQTVNFILIETTLSAPWYFVSSGFDSFVEIRNNSDRAISVTAIAYTYRGLVAGSQTVVIPGNGVSLVPVSGLVAGEGSGSVTLTHNAMPGSVTGNITTLNGATGIAFDAPFTPRMVWSMF